MRAKRRIGPDGARSPEAIVQDLARVIAESSSLEAVLSGTATALERLGAASAAIAILEPESVSVRSLIPTGEPRTLPAADAARLGELLTGEKTLMAAPLVLGTTGSVRSLIAIGSGGANQGALELAFAELDPDRIGWLETIASLLSVALKNARVTDEVGSAFESLRSTRDRLARSDRLHALGEMAAGVAHDFNNVLSAILGRAQMLKVLVDDAEIVRSLEIIEQAALDGAGTVRRIQEFAKPRPDKDMTSVSIARIVEDTVARTHPRVAARDPSHTVAVETRLGSDAPVLANPAELRQVLTNLIYNALDAMPAGGRLTIETGTDDRSRVYVEVTDDGHGMDDATRERMFNPFFTTKGAKGTGLGLSVSHAIVQRHGGEFSVWSEKGRGCRIRVCLPGVSQKNRDPSGVFQALPIRPVGTRATILLVDDDASVRDALADILRTGNHDVVTAANGEEGLVQFRARSFDLVFTDLGMPGLNGCEVASAIKAIDARVPVALVTGWGVTVDPEELKRFGVDIVVCKPFRYQQILDLVGEAMERRKRG